MLLTLHQLQVFVTIVDQGSVRRAAEVLVVTQPAVSASLAALERAVGAELFRRTGRTIELTPAGHALDGYARQILGLVDEAVAAVRPEADGDGDEVVRLGATTASADHVLMPLLAKVRAQRPEAAFTVEVGNRARIWQLLADRLIDVAVSSQPPVSGPFVSLATRPNEFVLVGKPGVVWAGRLGDATWLVREEGSSTRAATDEVMAALGLAPATITIGSNSAIQRSAEAGLGLALLPADAVALALRSRALVTVRAPATPIARPWHVLVRAGEAVTAATGRLVADLVRADGALQWTAAGAALIVGGGQ